MYDAGTVFASGRSYVVAEIIWKMTAASAQFYYELKTSLKILA